MNNYIVINDQRIELTEEQVNRIIAAQNSATPTIKLSEVSVGDTFKIGANEFIVLEHSGDTTAIIRKELLPDVEFGRTNRYTDSKADEVCKKFADEIEAIVGEENIVLHTVDLTSNDGPKDYGTIKRRTSLLTADHYRRYIDVLDNFKPDNWWWLATPWSTEKHDSASYVLCVSPSGFIFYIHHYYGEVGVRPFCILKSNIFVSK